ncbi:MAG: hypothetical protein J5850_02785 [Clostridia bacterium]|nr:hypothetical protein [Clostridia bacterium]
MNRKIRLNNLTVLVLNAIVFISVLWVTLHWLTTDEIDELTGLDFKGIKFFKAFTSDSNVINAVSALLAMIFACRNLFSGEEGLPAWLNVLRLITVSSVGLTFITTALFLAPIEVLLGRSYFLLFMKGNFFLHFFNPVISFISLSFFERGKILTRIDVLLALIPTAVYSVVYALCVLAFRVWEDFYGFTLGGKYALVPFVFVATYSVTLLVAWVASVIHNRFSAEKLPHPPGGLYEEPQR